MANILVDREGQRNLLCTRKIMEDDQDDQYGKDSRGPGVPVSKEIPIAPPSKKPLVAKKPSDQQSPSPPPIRIKRIFDVSPDGHSLGTHPPFLNIIVVLPYANVRILILLTNLIKYQNTLLFKPL